MTVAIGLLARDGIVVAADTQITQGTGKFNQGKMQANFNTDGDANTGSCVIAGAGTIPHAEDCTQLLREGFAVDRQRIGMPLRRAFIDTLKQFHEDHIAPFAAYPADDRPSVECIIAYERNHRSKLYATGQTALSAGNAPYVAIGWGGQQARSLLDKLYRLPQLGLWPSVVLAAYVIHQVKESDIYCGGRTDIYYVANNRFGMISQRFASRLDAAMAEYGSVIEANTFRSVVGGEPARPAPDIRKARRLIRQLVREMSESRAML